MKRREKEGKEKLKLNENKIKDWYQTKASKKLK